MAGTVTQSFENQFDNVKIWRITWTADGSDGSVPATASTVPIVGRLFHATTDPGATAPTDNYDITLVDAEGVDAAQGLLANRDTANTEDAAIVYSGTGTHPRVNSKLTFTLANNAVNSATGECVVYYGA